MVRCPASSFEARGACHRAALRAGPWLAPQDDAGPRTTPYVAKRSCAIYVEPEHNTLVRETPMARERHDYDDIPGTFVFDAERSRQGYGINMFCMSLMKDDNRKAFK